TADPEEPAHHFLAGPDLRDRPVPARVQVDAKRLLVRVGLMRADDELGHASPACSPCPVRPSAAGPGRRRPGAIFKRWDCTDFPPPAASFGTAASRSVVLLCGIVFLGQVF